MKTKRMLINILIGLAVIVVVFLVIVALQPADYRVTRSAQLTAPSEAIFSQVNDLKKWGAWSPWAKIDPDAKYTFEGPAAGKGAAMGWVGNSKVGEGRMTITDSRPNEMVQFQIEFFKPMAGVSIAEFAFKPQGNQTEVTWTMTGKNNFIAKAMCLFMNMDKMIGGQFEQGFANLKSLVEVAAKR
jgi:hypothetical protein